MTMRMWITDKNGIIFKQLQAVNFTNSMLKSIGYILIVIFSLEEEVQACYKCGHFLWRILIVVVFKWGVAWKC